jgi:hypothetical protein
MWRMVRVTKFRGHNGSSRNVRLNDLASPHLADEEARLAVVSAQLPPAVDRDSVPGTGILRNPREGGAGSELRPSRSWSPLCWATNWPGATAALHQAGLQYAGWHRLRIPPASREGQRKRVHVRLMDRTAAEIRWSSGIDHHANGRWLMSFLECVITCQPAGWRPPRLAVRQRKFLCPASMNGSISGYCIVGTARVERCHSARRGRAQPRGRRRRGS